MRDVRCTAMDNTITEESCQRTKCSCQKIKISDSDGIQYFHHFKTLNARKRGRYFSQRTSPLLTLVLLTCLAQNNVCGFNLDVKFPTLVTIPQKKSYFGYSVDMYAGKSESWLLVGAPKSQLRGEIFKCKYEKDASSSNCTVIDIVKDSGASKINKDMFGATLKTGPNGKQLLACAPYFTDSVTVSVQGEFQTFYDMLGVCYFMDDFKEPSKNLYKLMPCKGARGDKHDGDEHGFCEIGMSAAFTKDGDYLILGAVGSFYRQGSMMRQKLPITNDVDTLPVHIGENKPKAPPGWTSNEWLIQSYDENYFGYAVATGKSIEGSQLLFVGAPRRFGYDLLGIVEVYDEIMDAALYNFTGKQIGEYFGSAIAAVDLNNDGLDDLIVGASLYSDGGRRLVECGRIYVYYQQTATQDPLDDILRLAFSEPVIVYGTRGRARFGLSIAAIGDINQDGYEDVAVGAPYTVNDPKSNNSDGSVFIFNGGPEGLIIPASQEIKGIKLDDSLTAFGYSTSGNKDVDQNGYPDVIAGAYLSDQAVLIRSRPVVEISSVVTAFPDVVDIETVSCAVKSATTSCFKIRTCFSYTGRNVPDSIKLGYSYDIDSSMIGDDKRAFILDESQRNITLHKKNNDQSETSCSEEFAFFKIDIRDKLSEIKIKVLHFLIDRNQPVEPVLNELKPPFAVAKVNIYKDCGEDDVCQADLSVKSYLDSEVVYAGKSYPIALKQSVANSGESAFLTILVVEYPRSVFYVGTQDKAMSSGIAPLCTNIDQFVTCEIGNPMKRDVTVDVNLKFQTSVLNGNFSSLTFKSFVNSTNPTNNTSEAVSAPLTVGVKSDIVIYNFSSPGVLYLNDSDREEKKLDENLTSIMHTYEVINKGPSAFSYATIFIMWPLKTSTGLNLLELTEIVDDSERFSCGAVQTNKPQGLDEANNITEHANYHFCDGRAECASVSCMVEGPIDELSITLKFMLPLKSVLQNDMDSFIRSDFQFKIGAYPYAIGPEEGPMFQSTITTSCIYDREPEAKSVQWWIVAIAVGAGLLFLFLIVFALWKCGFFKRKKKPESTVQESQKAMLNPKGGVDEDAEEMEQYLK